MAAYRHLSADGVTEIVSMLWPNAVAGEVQTPLKFGIQNVSDRILGIPTFPNGVQLTINMPIGENTGFAQMFGGLDATTISCPYGMATLLSAGSGVWSAPGEYGWVAVAVKGGQPTGPSLETTFNVTTLTDSVSVSWTAISGATYRLYRRAPAGTYATPALVYSGSSPSFIDHGAAPGAGTPSGENLTGGAGPAYGTPPALVATPLLLGTSLGIGQQVFYWMNRVIPVSTAPDGSPYTSMRVPVEF